MAEVAVAALILAILIPLHQAVTMVQEVGIGDTAVLFCPSNDDNHRFQFWQLQSQNLMIGPTNKFNRDKYKYEVLTGTLYIRGVSSNEQGVYTCICKHTSNNSFYAENVELIVKRDWEEVYETDHVLWQMKNLLMRLALSTVGSCLTWTVTGWTQSFHDHPPSQRFGSGTQPSSLNLTF